MEKTGTHSGVLHSDEGFGVATLDLLGILGILIRTRDPKALAECTRRLDVGGKYDPAPGDFDHHQKGGAGVRENGIPYASFGLVWRHYGTELCGSEAVATLIDERLVQGIDALDCGHELIREYAHQDVRVYSISDAISAFNPSWQENPKPEDFDRQFLAAVEVAKAILQREIIRAKGDQEATSVVKEAYQRMVGSTSPLGLKVLVLERFCPWQETLFDLDIEGVIQFVVFPSETGDWRIQVVPAAKGVFKARRDLPATWAGKRDEELAQLTDCKDAVFCHNARFIAGAKSKESILHMAELALRS